MRYGSEETLLNTGHKKDEIMQTFAAAPHQCVFMVDHSNLMESFGYATYVVQGHMNYLYDAVFVHIEGAMKPTTDGRWAHLACVMWIQGDDQEHDHSSSFSLQMQDLVSQLTGVPRGTSTTTIVTAIAKYSNISRASSPGALDQKIESFMG